MVLQGNGLTATVSSDLGQIQIAGSGPPWFANASDIGFLGAGAARSIGDGARWRHPFPQDWPWPPYEPSSVSLESSEGALRASIDDAAFLERYAARTSMELKLEGGTVRITARLENLGEGQRQAWIVAPFAVLPGHNPEAPTAAALFPLLQASDLEPLRLDEGAPRGVKEARRVWHVDDDLVVVTPGGSLAERQDKLMVPSRYSLFARAGDSFLISALSRGMDNPEAFQVYAGIGAYVELEWAGGPVGRGQTSIIDVSFSVVSLADLKVGFGKFSSAGLKSELPTAARAWRALA
jgi:hypothetical protein